MNSLPLVMVVEMAEGNGTPTTPKQEMEARQSKPWTLREFWGKTAWDWMELLIVPVMLLLITVAFTWQQNSRQEAIEEQRAQDLALQGYLDQMGTLMLEDLSDRNVQTVMRARTLTVLRRLDPSQRSEVMQFLIEADLVQSVGGETSPIIDLSDANLSGTDIERGPHVPPADLIGAELEDANLRGANLGGADLSDADLDLADLSDADLRGADLRGAILVVVDLSDADLRRADLGGADLYSADLGGADLRHADLSDADLRHADLSDADLSDADLSDAVGVSKQELEQEASDLTDATMPNGSVHP